MKYTDEQLKQALAKMLPEVVTYIPERVHNELHWNPVNWHGSSDTVRDTQLLHLCWLVENTLCCQEYSTFSDTSFDLEQYKHKSGKQWGWLSMDWRQRVIALAKVKGIDL